MAALGRVACILLLLIPAAARAATPAEIQTAIDKAKAYLYANQFEGTRWERDPVRVGTTHDYFNVPQADSWGGWTALCTYALLIAGEKPADPRVAKPIEFLRKEELIGVYSIALRANVWNLLPPSDDNRKAAKRDADMLMRGMNRADTPQKGLYHYTTEGGGIWHNSTTQYAVLGMWAADRAGVETPREYWQIMDQTWRRNQHPDGGWTYHVPNVEGQFTHLGLTSAGVASLFITHEMLTTDAGSVCKGNFSDPAIERGLKWVGDHFKANAPLYDMFAMERIGLASGYRYFGKHDWYAEGADALVKAQQPDGSWVTAVVDGMMPVPNTAQALIFLCRGRAPTILHKLQYDTAGKTGHWNQRPRDVAHFTQWMSRQLERELNWQIVNFDTPVEHMLEAPILYIAGNQRLVFSAEQKAKLKAYVEAGGMILGNSDCGNAEFTTGFKKLGAELFPTYEFRDLPRDHVLMSQQFKLKNKPVMLGLSNGVRELMLCIPQADPGRYWQIGSKPELSQLAANIVLYTMDRRDLRYKGETFVITPSPTTRPTRTIKLARLQYPGNADPEPGGWRRLAAHLLNTRGVELTVEPVTLGTGKLAGYKVAHLTGTTPIKLTDPARAELKSFVESGGTLLIDAAGGSSAFATSMETELQATFNQLPKDPLPADHAIYQPIKEFTYREYAKVRLGQLKTPRLRTIDVNGRAAVFFSAEDLSAGLVGHGVDGITGYTPATATAIMTNLVLQGAP